MKWFQAATFSVVEPKSESDHLRPLAAAAEVGVYSAAALYHKGLSRKQRRGEKKASKAEEAETK